MEIIPAISRISGFDAEINRLHNSSFISRFLAGIQEISQVYGFWTLGALILAFFATFTRFKLITFKSHKVRRVISQPSFKPVSAQDDDNDSSDDDDDDETSCSSSVSEFECEEENYKDEDFRVAGSRNYNEDRGHNLNPFTWSDFATGRRVVKSWPDGFGLGLGLGLENSTGSLVSMWDLNNNNNKNENSFFSTSSMVSPSVIMSAGIENSKNVALRVWDTRVGRHIPEIFAEWQPRWKTLVGIDDSGGGSNINISSSVEVRDIRNVKSPVEGLTVADILNKNLRWASSSAADDDAVIVDGIRRVGSYCFKDQFPENVSRYLSYLFYP